MARNSLQSIGVEDLVPSPTDFIRFVPWACKQLQLEFVMVITKTRQQEYITSTALSDRSKSRTKSRPKFPSNIDLSSEKVLGISPFNQSEEDVVSIEAHYDLNDNLVQIKFLKNKVIPRPLLQIIGLIVQYHIYLTNITICSGMDQYTLYEIAKFLPHSRITDICLDNTYLKEANYHVLLEHQYYLKHLSLSRCSIDDNMVEAVAAALVHPNPAAKSLSILNLASNKITDVGAKFLSNALRSNRQLGYLNLSDNMITDSGAFSILDTLVYFPLCFSELLASKSRRIAYLKEKRDLTNIIVKNLRASDLDKRASKRKSLKPTGKKLKLEKEVSLKSVPEASISTMEEFLEKASILAEDALGEYKDPFNKDSTYVKDNIVYSFGNNTLCCLNLAYNRLSYLSVKKLLDVLLYQKSLGRRPKGLLTVCTEGNNIPEICKEYTLIDQILNDGLSLQNRRMSTMRKKVPPKLTPK